MATPMGDAECKGGGVRALPKDERATCTHVERALRGTRKLSRLGFLVTSMVTA